MHSPQTLLLWLYNIKSDFLGFGKLWLTYRTQWEEEVNIRKRMRTNRTPVTPGTGDNQQIKKWRQSWHPRIHTCKTHVSGDICSLWHSHIIKQYASSPIFFSEVIFYPLKHQKYREQKERTKHSMTLLSSWHKATLICNTFTTFHCYTSQKCTSIHTPLVYMQYCIRKSSSSYLWSKWSAWGPGRKRKNNELSTSCTCLARCAEVRCRIDTSRLGFCWTLQKLLL